MKKQRVFIIGLTAVGLAFAAGVAAAAEYTWTGGGADANWTTVANWGGAGYPDDDLAIAAFTNAASVTLDADVTLGRVHLNGGGSTVTINGTNTITVGLNIDSVYKTIQSQDANDRLVICPKVVMGYSSSPNERLYCNYGTSDLGTIVFQNTVQLNSSGAAFLLANGQMELSGDADVYSPGSATMFMAMRVGSVSTCRLTDRASLKLANLRVNENYTAAGRVRQTFTATANRLWMLFRRSTASISARQRHSTRRRGTILKAT